MSPSAGWRPDPYGAHELRFFAADGKPTLLVMDGERTSYDRPPTTEPPAVAGEASPEPPPPAGPLPPAADPSPPSVVAGNGVATPPVRRADTANADGDETALDRPRTPFWKLSDFEPERPGLELEHREAVELSRSRKIAYGVVVVALALSVLGFVIVHLPGGGARAPRAEGSTTTSRVSPTTTTTVALPTALQPGPEAAATALVSSWGRGNKTAALTVAMPAAVTALFAHPYSRGLAEDRGCSTAFTPIVCTFGPPGGASPTDPIYQIDVSQAPGGWYVSSVKVEN